MWGVSTLVLTWPTPWLSPKLRPRKNSGFQQWFTGSPGSLTDRSCQGRVLFSLCSGGIVRNHFKHSIELVDREGEIADVLAAVEDFLLARATYEAARQRWLKERIRLRQETRIVEDGSDPH